MYDPQTEDLLEEESDTESNYDDEDETTRILPPEGIEVTYDPASVFSWTIYFSPRYKELHEI